MVITRKLVFINFPKTGSSFIRKVVAASFESKSSRRSSLVRISKSIGKRLPDSRLFGGLKAACECIELAEMPYHVVECFNPVRGYYDQHGKVHQAPKQYLRRRFVSVARDPISRFCSYYHFFKAIEKDDNLPLLVHAIESLRTPLSEISPDAFYDHLFWKHNCIWMQSAKLQNIIGPQTLDFVNHFSTHPIEAFKRLREGARFADVRDLFPEDFVLLDYDALAGQLRVELKRAGISTPAVNDPIWTEKVLPGGIGGNFTRESSRRMLGHLLSERIEQDEWFLAEAYEALCKPAPNYTSQSKAA